MINLRVFAYRTLEKIFWNFILWHKMGHDNHLKNPKQAKN